MVRAKAIDHTCLMVSSLERSAAYYARLFGLEVRPREDDPLTLALECEQVRFFLSEAADVPREILGQQHLSLEVDSLSEVTAELDVLGVAYELGEVGLFEDRNYRWCEWQDPDGIRLECIEVLAR